MVQDIDNLELPQWYDQNMMTMLVVSPDTVFLFWELAFGQARSINDRRLVLRLYEFSRQAGFESESPHLVRNVEMPPLTNNWYFHDLVPDRCYRAEMGWVRDNRFYSIIRSNMVEVPAVSAAADAATPVNQWQEVSTLDGAQTTPGEQPIRATVRELIDSMSFYMGIRKDDGTERK